MKFSLALTSLLLAFSCLAQGAVPDFSGKWLGSGSELSEFPSGNEVDDCPALELEIEQTAGDLRISRATAVCGGADGEKRTLPTPAFKIRGFDLKGRDPHNGIEWIGTFDPGASGLQAFAIDDDYQEDFTVRRTEAGLLEYRRTLSEPGSQWRLILTGTLKRVGR